MYGDVEKGGGVMKLARISTNVIKQPSLNELASPKTAQIWRKYLSKIKERERLHQELRAIRVENALLRERQ